MTQETQQVWERLKLQLLASHSGIELGKMMAADALTVFGKVFAFHSTKGGRPGLGCRIGRDADPGAFGVKDWQYLAPFKTKPPMRDWIVVGISDHEKWPEIAEFCFRKLETQLRSAGQK